MSQRPGEELHQADYDPTPYEDASWEIVGQSPMSEEFIPLEVEVIPTEARMTDRMFEEFGGSGHAPSAARRWHLPDTTAREQDTEREKDKHTGPSEEELRQIQEQFYKKGLEEGLAQAAKKHSVQMERAQAHLDGTLRDMARQMQEFLQSTETQAVQLSIAIAKRIIDEAVEINPEYVLQIVREALRLSGGAAVSKVRLSPQDMEFIEYIGAARHLKEYDGSWKFEADPSVKEGCVIETSAGEVDYQLDAAWERVKESVLKVIR